ncbi:MAG TPA: magnesium/cobalt transporter CorA [Syntrophomonadaceae bacterium]|nr:magnesium/cobalt transporter CorA [Syntrophomonadaceae bacterium]
MIKTYFYHHEDKTMYHDVDLNQKDELLASPQNLLWIDLFDCTASELNEIGRIFDFHPLALEDCLQESPRAKVDRYDDYSFFVFHALRYFEEAEEEDEITSIELDVFMGSNYVVTIHPVALAAVGKLARVCLKDIQYMLLGPEHLLYRIIDNIVDDYYPIMERLGERIDDLEDNIFIKRGQETFEEILALKTTLILLRKVLIPQRRIFGNVGNHYSFFVNDENVPYYVDLLDHMDSILDTSNTYRDLVNSSTEIYYSIISGRTNEIITVLTIMTVIMMPLTVITGFYGMNVNLPGMHNPWASFSILGGMMLLSLGMLVFFRRRRWI